jgi:hypothetical protein
LRICCGISFLMRSGLISCFKASGDSCSMYWR